MAIEQYTPDGLKQDQQSFDNSVTDEQRTVIRNKIIFGVASAIDISYRNFSDGFYVQEGSINTALDVILIGLGASGTLAGGATFKAILAATSAGITGSRLAFAKNFFKEKGPDVILGRMNALRAQQWAVIYGKLGVPASAYGLPEASHDLIVYYNAGTITAAYDDIIAKSGSDQVKANEQLSDEIQRRFGRQMLTVEDEKSDNLLIKRFRALQHGKLSLDGTNEIPLSAGMTPDKVACNILTTYQPTTLCSPSATIQLRDLISLHTDQKTDEKLNEAFVAVAGNQKLH
jgi:hypothetical protein